MRRFQSFQPFQVQYQSSCTALPLDFDYPQNFHFLKRMCGKFIVALKIYPQNIQNMQRGTHKPIADK